MLSRAEGDPPPPHRQLRSVLQHPGQWDKHRCRPRYRRHRLVDGHVNAAVQASQSLGSKDIVSTEKLALA